MITDALILIYFISAGLLTVLTGGGFVLTLIYLFKRPFSTVTHQPNEWPQVTVQLPIYNERYVVERLLRAVCNLDYPADKLTVQLLDDSTDITTTIAARVITQLRQHVGCEIQHIRRANRDGYKAGALTYGMTESPTSYYAIFDADFIPPRDFLKRLMPYLLENPQLGLVQGRWGHLNSDDNLITAAQTVAIDAHFIIEQTARTRADLLLNFNGTGGIWRADCITAAGGWRDDTLTEDFDLSYRAQLAGWQLMTVPDMVVPGELPRQLTAFKQQQYRWAKGSTQVLMQTIRPLWQQAGISVVQRVMGTLHLAQYMPYPLLILLPLLSPPLLLSGVMDDLSLGFMTFSGIVPPLMYVISQIGAGRGWQKRLIGLPSLILFGTGIAINNTLAILSALLGQSSGFQRTPKHGNHSTTAAYVVRGDAVTMIELLMSAYVLWGAWLAWSRFPIATPYLLLSALSYGVVGGVGVYEQYRVQRLRQSVQAVGD